MGLNVLVSEIHSNSNCPSNTAFVEILAVYVGVLPSISDLGRRTSREQVLFAKKACIRSWKNTPLYGIHFL